MSQSQSPYLFTIIYRVSEFQRIFILSNVRYCENNYHQIIILFIVSAVPWLR